MVPGVLCAALLQLARPTRSAYVLGVTTPPASILAPGTGFSWGALLRALLGFVDVVRPEPWRGRSFDLQQQQTMSTVKQIVRAGSRRRRR